jgi:hypothetical protein
VTFEEAKQVVSRIRYKPGWRMKLRRARDESLPPHHFDPNPLPYHELAILFDAPDARNWEDLQRACPIPLVMRSHIHPRELAGMTEESLVQYLRHQIAVAEQHEADEWFRLDGVQIRNPHPEGR